MKEKEPNWGLAFGSGSFLLVWCLGLLAALPIEVVALRSAIATFLGAAVGLLVGKTVQGLEAMRENLIKGSKLDITLPAAGDDLMPMISSQPTSSPLPEPPGQDDHPSTFQPMDLKNTARTIQNLIKE